MVSIGKYRNDLIEANIRKAEVTKIIAGLNKLIDASISSKDLDIVVKEVIKDARFRDKFISAPMKAAQSVCEFKVEIQR